MAVIQIFSYPLLIRHYSRICSKTSLFCFLLIILEFYLPYYITSRTQGFWRVTDNYREKPDVKFKHKMLLIMETPFPDELIFWSTFENLNQLIDNNLQKHLPSIEHREVDGNLDGKHDELQMNIDMPVSSKNIVSLKMIILFDYKLHDYIDFQMESAAYIHYTSSVPGASFTMYGDLCIVQREALKYSDKIERYKEPVIEDNSFQSPNILEDILLNFARRNVTTSLRNTYSVWQGGPGLDETFKINLVIGYPEDSILYRTGLQQRLLWAVVQYLAIFFIIQCIFKIVCEFLLKFQMLPSIVCHPVKLDCMKTKLL